MNQVRVAEVTNNHSLEQVQNYLPANYGAVEFMNEGENRLFIVGIDDHGWTLDGYVIPRLGSGLIGAVEIDSTELGRA